MAPRKTDLIAALKPLRVGTVMSILVTTEVEAAIDGLDTKRKGRLKGIMGKLADYGPQHLPNKQFANEGRWPTGETNGRKIMIEALKVRQFRVYGHQMTIDKNRYFIGVCVDPSKKNNAADQALLAKAAHSMRQICEAV
ncbi:hypothetical protein E9232_004912 [Inquilinus ginsengisoli]|uniref:Uncharacterized protein n=1 Tax=Inquilinus ginsengisoli TaxID=363840 RepID=A0ABU1JUS8_9PROT|nr:hypothetical protein [Inquilinus ginsengisoli]MDR6292372.1 hypothetical protein [Inquilinus ginsengisoli]